MIILGVILLVVAFVAKIAILWTIGIILVVIGVILWILGSLGHAVRGRALLVDGLNLGIVPVRSSHDPTRGVFLVVLSGRPGAGRPHAACSAGAAAGWP
jgi:hypothetical protein